MTTTVVGFRLGRDDQARQVTVIVTEAGVLHRSHGAYGAPSRLSKPNPPVVKENPVHRQILQLRATYAEYARKGYIREIIPPACVRLETTEYPLHATPFGPHAPDCHPELLAEFTAAAPGAPRSLEEAIHDFCFLGVFFELVT